MYNMQKDKVYFIVSCNIWYKKNLFLIAKKAILLLVNLINKEKSLYIGSVNINRNTKIMSKNKDIKMLDIKYITCKSKHNISSQLRLRI